MTEPVDVRQYRPRTKLVETLQWTGDNEQQLVKFTGGQFRTVDPDDRTNSATAEVWNDFYSAWIGLRTGDSIMRTVHGHFQPITATVLAAKYEAEE